jgi:hypothetical protein
VPSIYRLNALFAYEAANLCVPFGKIPLVINT